MKYAESSTFSLGAMDKQHILAEIRRTAKENDGRPLGRERFYRETGIKTSDWLGKYWARWGDAVREAHLEPNQIQSALSESYLLEKLVSLIRELGRFPAYSEVRLKAYNTPGFPSHNTFARLGSRSVLAARIEAYCKEREGYDDVVTLCCAATENSPISRDSPVEITEDFGFVYLMKSGRYYKVGRSNATGRREYELAIQLPEKAVSVHVIRTDDPVGIEAYWHKRFDTKRKNGEWFDLDQADVKAFKRRKFM
jgi:hypothetical protein